MSNSRRDFLKLSSLGVLGFTSPIQKLSAAFLPNNALPGKDFSFGLQLWSVKEDMALDAKDTLQKIAADGYSFVESFEGKEGMFWGMGHKAFKSYLDELKISILSSHCDIQKDFERKAAEAAEMLSTLVNELPEETLQEALESVHAEVNSDDLGNA